MWVAGNTNKKDRGPLLTEKLIYNTFLPGKSPDNSGQEVLELSLPTLSSQQDMGQLESVVSMSY